VDGVREINVAVLLMQIRNLASTRNNPVLCWQADKIYSEIMRLYVPHANFYCTKGADVARQTLAKLSVMTFMPLVRVAQNLCHYFNYMCICLVYAQHDCHIIKQ